MNDSSSLPSSSLLDRSPIISVEQAYKSMESYSMFSGDLFVRLLCFDVGYEEPIADEGLDAAASIIYPQLPLNRVPVLKVFGITDTGQKILVNIHQCYPYLYVKYECDGFDQSVYDYAKSLAISINHALAVSLNRPTDPAKCQFVMAIVLVKAYDFYGYNNEMSLFLKIYLLDPFTVSRLSDLLSAGAIMGKKVQPYESHIPFVLQFMMDHNLYGMDYMRLSNYKFRIPFLPNTTLARKNQKSDRKSLTDKPIIEEKHVPANKKWAIRDNIIRSSSCELEVDSWPWYIKNRLYVNERKYEPNSPILNRQIKLVSSLETIWKNIRNSIGLTELPDNDRPDDTFTTSKSDYYAKLEKSIRDTIEKIKNDHNNSNSIPVNQNIESTEYIDTLFSSVTALYPSNEQTNAFGNSEQNSIFQSSISIKIDSDADVAESVPSPLIDTDIIMSQSQNYNNLENNNNADTFDKAEYSFDSDEVWKNDSAWENSDEIKLDELLNEMSQESLDEVDKVIETEEPVEHMEDDENPILKKIKKRLGQKDYNPDRKEKRNFISSLNGQWSPVDSVDSVETKRWAFFHSPPRPTSPSVDSSADVLKNIENFSSFDVEIDLNDNDSTEKIWKSQLICPSYYQLEKGMKSINGIEYQLPYFSKDKDRIENQKFALEHNKSIKSLCVCDYPKFQMGQLNDIIVQDNDAIIIMSQTSSGLNLTLPKNTENLQYSYYKSILIPPTFQTLKRVKTKVNFSITKAYVGDYSQIDGPTGQNEFKLPDLQSATKETETSIDCKYHLTLCSMELFAETRQKLNPNPQCDCIKAIFYSFNDSDHDHEYLKGFIQINDMARKSDSWPGSEVILVRDEEELILEFIDIIVRNDPDVLCGWDVHKASWGYLIERAAHKFNLDIASRLSRIVRSRNNYFLGQRQDEWGLKKSSGVHIGGRIVLNIWRLIRSEIALTHYSYENVYFHVLHHRVPKFTHETLTKWYGSSGKVYRWRTISYFMNRIIGNFRILDKCNIIVRTIEFARVFGVEFFSVITRGSQFKVESMMIRLAHPENFIMISPSRQQVASMRALECLPLVMEPESGFYSSPVIVLDFQSLYPSIIIAYNFCYSTCLGKFFPSKYDTFGFKEFEIPDHILKELNFEDLTITPNGVVFVKPHIRQSVLRRMLSELLSTRVMSKTIMKQIPKTKRQYRIWDSRQLGIKYISNVTYGYTSASFSGRMPCVDIADSIVQTGRETLEKAIKIINSNSSWNAKVVYGDTDSLFVSVPGRTRKQAFEIGNEIAKVISNSNPKPMKLKFEKVYHPCVLLTKKRYVGFKYENPDQKEPEFEAKGIETVRRDGCPVVAKTLEQSLKILFKSQDLSQLKNYLMKQFEKIMTGRANMQDFIISKEVKLGIYSENGVPPPGAYISLNQMKIDPRSEPAYGERVPFIISYVGSQSRLVDAARFPVDFIFDKKARLDSNYYITRQILPVLARIFDLIGVDVKQWFEDLPKYCNSTRQLVEVDAWNIPNIPKNQTGNKLYQSRNCCLCRKTISHETNFQNGIFCNSCLSNYNGTIYQIKTILNKCETQYFHSQNVCNWCIGANSSPDIVENCISIDCPVFFERVKRKRLLEYWEWINSNLENLSFY